MRFHRIRSLVIMSLAALAGMFMLAIPASAALMTPIERDADLFAIHVQVHYVSHEPAKFSAAVDKFAAQRDAMKFLDARRAINTGGTGAGRMPFDLKPIYTESDATDGHSFIDVRLRC